MPKTSKFCNFLFLKTLFSFSWEILEPIMVKGKVEPVPIFHPCKQEKKSLLWDRLKQSLEAPKAIYGRQAETEAITELIARDKGIMVIQGDAGIGIQTKWHFLTL